MMDITELELNSEGNIVALKGTFRKTKVFSIVTDKVLFWAEYGLEYVGG